MPVVRQYMGRGVSRGREKRRTAFGCSRMQGRARPLRQRLLCSRNGRLCRRAGDDTNMIKDDVRLGTGVRIFHTDLVNLYGCSVGD